MKQNKQIENNQKLRIALFIDGDNLSLRKYIPDLVNYCKSLGKLKIKRIYGLSKIFNDDEFVKMLAQYKIKIIKNYLNGIFGRAITNSTDYFLINDVVKLLNKKNIDVFCIGSNDSDFLALTSFLRINHKKIVYGFGGGGSPFKKELKYAYDKFFLVEELKYYLDNNSNFLIQKVKELENNLAELQTYNITITFTSIEELKPIFLNFIFIEAQDWTSISELKTIMDLKLPNFHYKEYANKFGKFLALFEELEFNGDRTKVRLKNKI